MAPRTAVVGVGNCLMQDDGVGVHVVRVLAERPLPDDVDVIDAGTDPDTAFDVEGADRVIVIDAARGDRPPGTVYRFSDGVSFEPPRRLCHDVGFLQTLRDASRIDGGPEVVVIGVEPQTIAWGMELSPAVAACLPRIVDRVEEELGRTRCS